jgi:hypothetical protein
MRKTYLLPFGLVGLALITMAVRCQKEISSPQIIPVYQYVEKLTLAPFKKVYAINDTIRVQFQTTNKTLYDKLSDRRIATDTTFLNVNFNLVRQYPVGFNLENYATVTVENGLDVDFAPVIAPRNALTFKTGCVDSLYFFKAAFVLKKTGVFTLEPTALVSPCPDKKVNIPSTFVFTFDLADCNKDVWSAIERQSLSGIGSYVSPLIERKQIFAFKVE